MKIKIYTQNGCPQCKMTKRVLGQLELPYEEINVSLLGDKENKTRNYLKDDLNFRAFPCVITEEEAWSGFRPDKLKALKGLSDGQSL